MGGRTWDTVNYGLKLLNTGGIYDPVSNTWTATSTVNAPKARCIHSAIWTGSKMIIWGGTDSSNYNDLLNTGGIYDPVSNTWVSTSTINAPYFQGTANCSIWTGTKMIVWVGDSSAAYDPILNQWTYISNINAPTFRERFTIIWTGTKMIIWGGLNPNGYLNSGGLYDPLYNNWISTSTYNAPHAREYATAVWTGSKMIIWGGDTIPHPYSGTGKRYFLSQIKRSKSVVYPYLNSGGYYDPVLDTWIATTLNNAPSARLFHTAVWTGNKMIIWGGQTSFLFTNTGAIYSNPAVIGINQKGSEIPTTFSLSQNYPNPFNPKTKIDYQLPKPAKVVINVYDIFGRRVKELMNENKDTGFYTVTFDATNFASGVYFYQINAADYTSVKKMVLVK